MSLNMDSWVWRIAIVVGIFAVREFIRFIYPPLPKEDPKASSEGSGWLIEMCDSAAIAIGLVLFVIQPFLLQAFYIPSGSMEDTLQVKDRLLVSKLVYRLKNPNFQDVVVFRAPEVALSPGTPEGTDFIKRCMGLPGDIVYTKNRQVYRQARGEKQAKKISEPYTKWEDNLRLPSGYDMKIIDGKVYSRNYILPDNPGRWSLNDVPLPESQQEFISNAPYGAIPEGQYLMLGDHRNNSNDGHVWGFVPRENIIGKAITIFWPPTRIGVVDVKSYLPPAGNAVKTPNQPVKPEQVPVNF